MRNRITTGIASIAAATLMSGAAFAAAAPATAAPEAKPGTQSLATVLAADGTTFDKNWQDFDIVEKAVLTVLEAKPDSPVALLTQGDQRATAFIPTDAAFRNLVQGLKGFKPKNERKTFKQVAKLVDVDTLESILLYHVVAGKTLVSDKVVASEGKKIKTALGKKFRIHISNGVIQLVDKDRDARNPRVVGAAIDINRGNKQVAHGIDRVLRPIDL